MRRTMWAVGLALGVVAVAALPARAADQRAIDDAVSKGVQALRALQRNDGTWPHAEIGATALAGLTLLECDVAADDKAVDSAAEAVRRAAIPLRHTYSLALSILFLDRLGDPADVPFIESMAVRLLAGQNSAGGWSYTCPAISDAEQRRLAALLGQRRELSARRSAPGGGGGEAKKTVRDLSPEVRQQLAQLQNFGGGGAPGGVGIYGGDNSNTQFATIALWVARRHGLPVDGALKRVDDRFRSTQNPDGGWSYLGSGGNFPGPGGGPGRGFGVGSTATMTCAGLLGLAVGQGVAADRARDRDERIERKREKEKGRGEVKQPAVRERDPTKDPVLRNALVALSSAIGQPVADRDGRLPVNAVVPQARGKSFYFLWSLERVAVALNQDTILKKDWYGWGCEILLAAQLNDGSWQGDYSTSGADTCFALLFLRRANLARDLSASLKGRTAGLGTVELKGGGTFDPKQIAPGGGLKSGIDGNNSPPGTDGGPAATAKEPGGAGRLPREKIPSDPNPPSPRAETPTRPAAAQAGMADELVNVPADRRGKLLEKLRDGRGVEFTDALVDAIPNLDGDAKKEAREALAERLSNFKADTVAQYLAAEEAELRRAAALAIAMKDARSYAPKLAALLRDREPLVVRAAHAALKAMAGKDLGTDPAVWEAWAKKQKG